MVKFWEDCYQKEYTIWIWSIYSIFRFY